MEIDSLPVELDELKRRVRQLEIERQALARETDSASKERLRRLDEELARLKDQEGALEARWRKEKEVVTKIRELKAERERIKTEEGKAERLGDLARVAELRYGQLLQTERQIEQENARLAKIQIEQRMLKEEVDDEDIAQVVAKWTGIPVTRLLESEIEKLVHMEDRLHARVIGQGEAIEAVSNAIRRSRAGLSDPNRPMGSFIFLGPTGVGKTELARALAEFLFDSDQAMVRIDMSEYMEKHAVSRLIGAPPGYVGYEEGGQLSEAVRRRPYSVVLFDEIEKAHPDVFNVLLQILDDGRLTDGQGRTVDFRNSVIIMTSNLGSQFITSLGGGRDDEIRHQVMDALRANFRPEFLNRIDETIIFRQLTREQIGEIVQMQLDQIGRRLAERQITLTLTHDAREMIATLGYDPIYGARPLKRVIQKQILDPLALKLLNGQIREGEEVIVDIADGNFSFRGTMTGAPVVA
jgi:ATP-dependent Clp protease ATP-binding subunit ClpB